MLYFWTSPGLEPTFLLNPLEQGLANSDGVMVKGVWLHG